MSHLLMAGEVRDASGMASTALAEAIAYPGSSIAFAQLLSGMERSGLIEREIRGKRTYRIRAARSAVAPARPAVGPGGAQAAVAQDRAAADPAAVRLDSAEIRLLERLLSPLRDKGTRQEEAGAS